MPKSLGDVAGRLLIVGDSITLGATGVNGGDIAHRASKSYVDYLAESFPALDIQIDAAVHRTTAEARELLPALLEAHKPGFVLLMVGNNDADIEWKRFIMTGGRIVRHRVNVQRYTENLLALVGAALGAQAQPILTDIVNHDLARRAVHFSGLAGRDLSGMIEAGGGQAESDRRALPYKEALQKIVSDTGAALAPYAAALDEQGAAQMLADDGVHPSEAGHAVIARVLISTLSGLLDPAASRPSLTL